MYAPSQVYSYPAKTSPLTRLQTTLKSHSTPRSTKISPSSAPACPSADFHSRTSSHDISRAQPRGPQGRSSLAPLIPTSEPQAIAKAIAKATTGRKALERPPATHTRSRRGFLMLLLVGTSTKSLVHATWKWSSGHRHARRRRSRAPRRTPLRWTTDPASISSRSLPSRMRDSWRNERAPVGTKSLTCFALPGWDSSCSGRDGETEGIPDEC